MTEQEFNLACEAYRAMFRMMEGKSFEERKKLLNKFRSNTNYEN